MHPSYYGAQPTGQFTPQQVYQMQQARQMEIKAALLCGEKRGACAEHADVAVHVPSTNTARIQESHLVCVHIVCAAVEEALGGAD